MISDDDLDHTPMDKGKYGKTRSAKPLTPDQVAEVDPSYLVWAYETWNPRPCSFVLYKECKKDVQAERQHRRVARDQDVD